MDWTKEEDLKVEGHPWYLVTCLPTHQASKCQDLGETLAGAEVEFQLPLLGLHPTTGTELTTNHFWPQPPKTYSETPPSFQQKQMGLLFS